MLDLVTHYREGQRDFRGADLRGAQLQNLDLSGIDLSEADLRGADLSGAQLDGAKLRGVRCGRLHSDRIGQVVFGLLTGAVCGMLIVIGALVFLLLFNGTITEELTSAPGVLSLMLSVILLRELERYGRVGIVGILAISSAIAGAFISIIVSIFLARRGHYYDDVVGPVLVGSRSLLAVVVIVAGTVVTAGAGPIAAAGSAFVAASCMVFYLIKFRYDASEVLILVTGIIAQLAAAYLLRQRILEGAPEHSWMRNLSVALNGMGGTRFRGTDLRHTDFFQANLHSADLRGAVLDGVRFREARGLEWVRFDPGDLRNLSVQRLLISGTGAGHNFSGLRFAGVSLHGANLSGACLQGADLTGVDLSDACLVDAILDGARIDARTYVRSGWSPRTLAEFHQRGIEIVALQAFPLDAQDVIVGLRDGLVLSFAQPLTDFRQSLIEGSLYAIVGIESGCRIAEYREKDDSTSFVRIVGADRAELERVAEAFYRRIWEETQTNSTRELARRAQLLSDDLRQRLSELVRDLVEIELRQPAAMPSTSPALVVQGHGPATASESVWRWDQRTDRISVAEGHPQRLVILHASSEIDTGLCQELLKHMDVLKGQGLIETFHGASPGQAVVDTFVAEISKADVVLVLLSSDLLAELTCQRLLQAALRAETTSYRPRTVPVVVRACIWDASPLSGRQCLPESGRPVTDWGKSAAERDAGWVEVISTLRRQLLSMAKAQQIDNNSLSSSAS